METNIIPRTESHESVELSGQEQFKPELDSSIPTRWHPKLTVYRLLVILTTLGFSIAKAVLSYQGRSIVPITLEWLFGTGVFLLFFALDTYQARVRDLALPWLFDVDIVQFISTPICGLLGVPVIYNAEGDARRPTVIRGSRPPIRGYDLLVMVTTVMFGMTKSVMAFVGYNAGVTTVEWVSGAGVGVGLYWLGLYESGPINQMPYLFSKDYTRDIKRTMKYTQPPLLLLFQILLVGFSAWWSYLCSGWLVSLSLNFFPEKPGNTIFEKAAITLVVPGLAVSGMMLVVATIFAAIFAISVVLMSKFHVAALGDNASLMWDYICPFVIPFGYLSLLPSLLSMLSLCIAFIPELMTWTDKPSSIVVAFIMDAVWIIFFSGVAYFVVTDLRGYARQLRGVVRQWWDRSWIGNVGGIVRRGSMGV